MSAVIHLSAELSCSAERAFGFFTNNAGLQSWLVPLAEVEPVVGGKYELFWDPSDRTKNSTLGCKITALDPNKLLAFDWRGPEQFAGFMNEADPLTQVMVCFIPIAGGTEVHLVHSGWRQEPSWKEARKWFLRVWATAFAELAEKVNLAT